MKLFSLAFLGLLLISSSCKKSTTASPTAPKTTLENLQNRWIVHSYVLQSYRGHTNIQIGLDSMKSTTNEFYYEFNKDMNCTILLPGYGDILPYVMKGNNIVSIDTKDYKIISITQNSLELYYEDRVSTNYSDFRINLHR